MIPTKNDLKTDILYVGKILNKIPTNMEYRLHGNFCGTSSTIKNYFGSWNNALIDIFGQINRTASDRHNRKIVKCTNCNKDVSRSFCDLKKVKNPFCSARCAGLYNNAHKTTGFRRSKLEIWLQTKLKEKYPELLILFNNKDTINAELDIYFPTLRIAFELNGIFHYEPIYGPDKLHKVQSNDNRKIQACNERNIEMCIIDTSGMKHFKLQKAQTYFDIIDSILKIKLIVD